ncbi:hypothetical protein PROFUN_12739 [Planoprotostelium fungivorum]|uniref:Uncharacterized protein n=1 Tax=Planoprotostelium fungivorum TaxID=1890364 RepID=A0A2P6N8K1_9EUKA|nr:hypothetical protein PROFUN_12739 [Planoprotostelium fungivorum]
MSISIDSIAKEQLKGYRLQREELLPGYPKTAGPAIDIEGDEMMGGTLKVYLIPHKVLPLLSSPPEDLIALPNVQLMYETTITSWKLFIAGLLCPPHPFPGGDHFHIFAVASNWGIASVLSEPFRLCYKIRDLSEESQRQRKLVRRKKMSMDEEFDFLLGKLKSNLLRQKGERRSEKCDRMMELVLSLATIG